MRPRTYSDEGIVLARRSFGEADRILSIYSVNHGRISLIAKGVRKLQSRKRGHIEVFSRIKFSVAQGHGLDILTEAEIIDAFSEIRKDLKKVAVAYFFMEAIGRTTHEGEKIPELYSHILKSVRRLRQAVNLRERRLDFVVGLLTLLGFWPRGKPLLDPDAKLEEITERRFSSTRVGKKLLT